MSRARVLVVTPTDPRGETHGASMRLHVIVEALSEIGEVDVFLATSRPPEPEGRSTWEPASRFVHVQRPTRTLRTWDRLKWFVAGRGPLELAGRDYSHLRQHLGLFASGRYDLVWVGRSETYLAVAPALPKVPTIVDLDDLESEKLRSRLHLVRGRQTGERGLGRAGVLLQGARNVARWRRAELRTTRAVDRAVVCSDVDRDRLATDNVFVVPNSYPEPAAPLGRTEVHEPPTVLMQGSLTYPPNIDAARLLVGPILERVRETLPDACVRLVGRTGREAEQLHAPPNVVVTGFVDRIEDELARADAIIAPIRVGGGTRIKIIEALAHSIPVVATPLGAEGLGLVHAEHALLGETTEELAAATIRVLSDLDLRGRLRERGRAHFATRFERSSVVRRIEALAREAVER